MDHAIKEAAVSTTVTARASLPVRIAIAVIELKNDTPEVDFDAASAKLVYDTYELLDKGPKPSGSELAAGLNRHVAG